MGLGGLSLGSSLSATASSAPVTLFSGYTEDQFVMKVTTNMGGDYPYDGVSNNSDSTSMKIYMPRVGTGTNKGHIDIDWGDGNTDADVVDTITHDYGTAGTYTIIITPGSSYTRGTAAGNANYAPMNRFLFTGQYDCRKVIEILNWGCFGNHSSAVFSGCSNMTCSATDEPWDFTYTNNKPGNMTSYFSNCVSFNGTMSNWATYTSTANNLRTFFFGCNTFNQPLTGWDTSNVTQMKQMFQNAYIFNQSLAHFDTSSVTTVNKMFSSARDFDQDISGWDISNITDFTNLMSSNTGLSTANYNAILIGWAAQTVSQNESIHFGDATSSGSGTTAKNSLINDDGWTITDGDS
jgi:surface protein